MIAPSFQQSSTIISDVFYKNNKQYIKIRNNNTGKEREVRWYDDSEYAKKYSEQLPEEQNLEQLKQKKGFVEGPILVVRKNRNSDEEFLRRSPARYYLGLGWYFTYNTIIPRDAPPHFRYILLSWEEFIQDSKTVKSPEVLASIVDEKIKKKEWITLK